MASRVALLAFSAIAVLGFPLGGLTLAMEGDRASSLAQAPRLAEPASPTDTNPTGTDPEGEALEPAATESEASGSSAPQSTSLPSKEIELLQDQLASLGYYQGPVDGIFGTATGEAISLFQRDVGLATTGLPDPLTIQRLQATQNPLGIIPETPEETDSAASETGDGTTAPDGQISPDAASTPLDQGSGEAPLTEETAPTTEAEAAADNKGGGFMRLVLVGMLIAATGTAGAVAVLFLLRRPAPDTDLDPEFAGSEAPAAQWPEVTEDPAPPQIEIPSPVAAAVPEVTPPPPAMAQPPIVDAPRNGHRPAPEPITPPQPVATPQPIAPPQAVAQASTLATGTTTKLVPVNIIDELVQDLQNPDPTQRRKAIWELGQRGNSAAVQPLTRLMLDADSKERSLILAALAEISTQTLKPMNRALALSLQDENPEVRKNAIRDMTRIYDLMGQAGTMLNHAASDSDPEVRQTASWAMDQLNRMRLQAINTDAPSLQGHNGSASDHPQDS